MGKRIPTPPFRAEHRTCDRTRMGGGVILTCGSEGVQFLGAVRVSPYASADGVASSFCGEGDVHGASEALGGCDGFRPWLRFGAALAFVAVRVVLAEWDGVGGHGVRVLSAARAANVPLVARIRHRGVWHAACASHRALLVRRVGQYFSPQSGQRRNSLRHDPGACGLGCPFILRVAVGCLGG